jgi:hypothetical protein
LGMTARALTRPVTRRTPCVYIDNIGSGTSSRKKIELTTQVPSGVFSNSTTRARSVG